MSAATAPRIASPPSTARDRPTRRTSGLTMAWIPDGTLGYPEWVAAGRRLGEFARGSQWWVGDWIRYGNARWGEKYLEAAKISGYDGKSLRNLAYVASRFDLSRRRDKLTWSHHAELAVLEPHEQDRWLDRAILDKLSVADLRELRASRRSTKVAHAHENGPPRAFPLPTTLVCPNCGATVPVPANADTRPASTATS
jgi:hypothetical protein